MSYYIYRLRLTGTKRYYIGVTEDPIRREAHHLGKIRGAIIDIRRKKLPKGRPVHIVFATEIAPKVKNILDPHKIITWHYSFKILHKVETIEEARKMETRYLSRAGRHSLNVDRVSRYNGGWHKEKHKHVYDFLDARRKLIREGKI